MTGLGTMVNCAAIIAGCAVGLILKKGFPEKWQETIMYGVALCIFLIGVEMAQKSQNIVLVIASVVIGSIIGEMLDIQEKLNAFGAWVEKKLLGDRGQTSGSFGISTKETKYYSTFCNYTNTSSCYYYYN